MTIREHRITNSASAVLPHGLALRAPVTLALAGLCALVYLYQATLSPEQYELFVLRWAAIPVEIAEQSDFLPTTPIPLAGTLVSALFLHAGLQHLAGNLLLLLLFGLRLEPAVGSLRTLALFLAGGLAGGAAQIAAAPSSLVPLVGASGAIAALMGAALLLARPAPLHIWVFTLWAAVTIPTLASELTRSDPLGGGPAVWSHLFGIATGLALAQLRCIASATSGEAPRAQ